MTPCARGCCWSPFSCAKARGCACHWDERNPGMRNNGTGSHADPTANQAVNNVMKQNRRK